MFSTMTMALSTSMPRARIRLNSTTMLRVIPIAWMTMKLTNIDMGMASPTNQLLRKPMKKSSTRTTRIRPLRMLFSSSATMFSISRDWSASRLYSTPAGQVFEVLATTSRLPVTMAMMFSPTRFWMAREMLGVPFMRL